MDGSQKLPQRLLGTVRDNLAAGAPDRASRRWRSPAGCATRAAVDEAGARIEVADPLARDVRAPSLRRIGDDPAAMAPTASSSLRAMFGDDLRRAMRAFREAVGVAAHALFADGARAQSPRASLVEHRVNPIETR